MLHRPRLRSVLLPVLLSLVSLASGTAPAETFNDAYVSVEMTYFTGEPRYFDEILRQDTARLSRNERFDHAGVLASGGFVADASGSTLRAATELGAYVFPEAGGAQGTIYWKDVSILGFSDALTTDVLTITGPAGQTGALKFAYDVDGTLYHEIDPIGTGGGFFVDELLAQGRLIFQVQDQNGQTPVDETFEPPLQGRINPAYPRDGIDVASGPGLTDFFYFPFNTPFRVSYELNALVSLRARNVDAGEFTWLGGSGFEGTAHIRGLALYDALGQPVTDATIVSEAGIHYPVVPEPSSFALLAAGVMGLVREARRQSRSRSSAPASSARECTPNFSKMDRT